MCNPSHRMATEAPVQFFTLLLKLRHLAETFNGFTLQEIVAVDKELMAPLLEFAKDIYAFLEELEIPERDALMTWPKFIAVEGYKLRKQDPSLTQPQILQMLSPLWKQRNKDKE